MEETTAGQVPVEKPVELNMADAPKPNEYELLLAQKEAELQQLSVERDNYRKGMLKAKGKLDDEDDSEDERLRRIVREEVLSTQAAKLQAEKDQIMKDALRKVSELSIALKNKSQLTPSGGNSVEGEAPKDSFWSAEQVKYFKERGLDPEKVKENMLKGK